MNLTKIKVNLNDLKMKLQKEKDTESNKKEESESKKKSLETKGTSIQLTKQFGYQSPSLLKPNEGLAQDNNSLSL